MTSDAKIGLLLGLVFIFIIAFIINGLPSFRKDTNNNVLTTTAVGLQNNLQGLGTRERKVSREVINQNIRSIRPLPNSISAEEKTRKAIEIKPVAPALSPSAVAKKSRLYNPESAEPTLPKAYVVSAGDNLAVIAKKVYGPQDGNKRINITRIFKANARFMKSPDEIYEGQELIIPQLSASAPGKNKIASVFSTMEFAKVDSIGKRHLSTDIRRAKRSSRYLVQEGDSLWRIAAEQLGNGSRYSEIAELNADILDDNDSLSVGMRLKLPAR